jgi:hypothetical protein
VAGAGEVGAELVDERRLAGARCAADAHPNRAAGGRQDGVEQRRGLGPPVGQGRLDERDRPGQGPPVARPQALGQLAHRPQVHGGECTRRSAGDGP